MRVPVAAVMGTILLCPWACPGQTAAQPADAASWGAKGKVDLEQGYFNDAQTDVQKAIGLEPDRGAWHALLARVYLRLLLAPTFPDTQGMLPKAKAEAQRALELSPNDGGALLMVGKVKAAAAQHAAGRLGLVSSPAAKKYFLQALQADPNLSEAHYELAEDAMMASTVSMFVARQESHLPMGHMGWVSDPEVRRVLRIHCQDSVNDGISHADAALAIEPGYEKAMRVLAVLIMTRSYMRENEAEYDADNREADSWRKKADAVFAARPRVESKPNPGGGLLGAVLGSLPTSAPVPPPEPK